MRGNATHSVGGRIDPTAIVGHAPEDRSWRPGDPAYVPEIGSGARIEAFCTIDAGKERPTHIGEGAWLMKHVHVGHDAIIGAGAELAPHCSVGGHAEIGRKVKLGMGVIVKPYVKIGDGARIGMGAAVTRNVPKGETWAGVPAKRMPPKFTLVA